MSENTWRALRFDPGSAYLIPHLVHQGMLSAVVDDLRHRYPGREKLRITDINGPSWDLGGMVRFGRPRESIAVGDSAFSVPSEDVDALISELRRLTPRQFATGLKGDYYKLFSWANCTVLSGDDVITLIEGLGEVSEKARARSKAFQDDCNRPKVGAEAF